MGRTSAASAPLNPLRLSGTALPPPLLLMAKLVVLIFFVTNELPQLPDHFLPFVPAFDDLGSPAVFRRVLQVIAVVAAVPLFFNRTVRSSCLVVGAVISIGMLSDRLYFSNNRMFTALILLFTGLYEPGTRALLVRAQVVLLYFSAGLNKLLDADWRSGRFMDSWALATDNYELYSRVRSLLPGDAFPKLLAWSVIVLELGLVVGFLWRRILPAAVWFGVLNHTGILVATGRPFGMFYYVALASYLAFADWPLSERTVRYCHPRASPLARAVRALERLDLERVFGWRRADESGVSVEIEGRRWGGAAALWLILLHNPFTYVVYALVVSLPFLSSLRGAAALAFLLFLLPLLAPLGRTLRGLLADRRRPSTMASA
jgi:hypothetical protein